MNHEQSNELTKQAISILDNIDIAISITDLSTNEILFSNKYMRQIYGDIALTGKTCWEVFLGGNKRCDFCPIPYLLKNPGKSYKWQLQKEGVQFQLCDSIIPWSGGKLVHLQYMTEI